MRFEQYRMLRNMALNACTEQHEIKDPKLLNPIVLAYIGDVVFSLYVRMRLLPNSNQVRVLHDLSAKMVSAALQARAMDALTPLLTEEEATVAKRGRNTKSTVPKSATVREYRQGTALEALLGWLFLLDNQERLEFILDYSFTVISKAMQEKQR